MEKVIEIFGSGLFLALGLLALLLGIIFVIRWLLLPFAVFGVRDRLDRVLTQMAEMKSQIQHVTNVLDPDGTKARLHEQYADSLTAPRTAVCPHCHEKVTLNNVRPGAQHLCPVCRKEIEILH